MLLSKLSLKHPVIALLIAHCNHDYCILLLTAASIVRFCGFRSLPRAPAILSSELLQRHAFSEEDRCGPGQGDEGGREVCHEEGNEGDSDEGHEEDIDEGHKGRPAEGPVGTKIFTGQTTL